MLMSTHESLRDSGTNFKVTPLSFTQKAKICDSSPFNMFDLIEHSLECIFNEL